ncbi:hypothetical protein [Streptomyces sp. NBC_00568]|uniref:hypothetical protein n=1 Tax=Streptomyces sp. NBC_00568 TaxID=2975779 RepID=UPI00225BFEED|nr:hypothetical protein [Streptomyces sp. NBC_00568]MCX4993349.1 hypothetical protein [Streptomyces sp. NBC_00568]
MTRAPRLQKRTVHQWKPGTALLIAASLMALSACSSDDEDSGDSSKQPSSASSPSRPSKSPSTDPQAAARKDVLTAYSAFWREQVKAYGQANIKGTDLKKYATKEALGQAMADVLVMQQAGTATKGAPTHQAEVTSLTLTGSIPKASVRDCLDISHWNTIKKKSGQVKPFPSAQPLRYITTAKAEKWGKQWLITEVTPDGEQTC